MIDFQVAYDKLASLDCAEEIALFLKEQNIVAYRCEPQKCALAVYFSTNTDHTDIYVDGVSIDEWDPMARSGDGCYNSLAELTEPMSKFVSQFDQGRFPYLIAEDDND